MAHMQAAHIYAKLSYCKRKQVGCVIVKGENIIAIGYNGTPPGWENVCEGDDGLTLPYVHHAEENAIGKLAEGSGGGNNSVIFITCAPCYHCAKLIRRAGIKIVYYGEIYGGHVDGLEYLQKCGVETELVVTEE